VTKASVNKSLLIPLAVFVALVGVCTTVYYTEEKDLRMAPGDMVTMAGYEFRFNEMRKVRGPNYTADQAEIEVLEDGVTQTLLFPEKRFYKAAGNVMTEADIDPTLFRDLYVALGEPIGGTAWAVRVHYKPFVRWIWFGGLLIALGGFTTILDRRYRAVKQARQISLEASAAA